MQFKYLIDNKGADDEQKKNLRDAVESGSMVRPAATLLSTLVALLLLLLLLLVVLLGLVFSSVLVVMTMTMAGR